MTLLEKLCPTKVEFSSDFTTFWNPKRWKKNYSTSNQTDFSLLEKRKHWLTHCVLIIIIGFKRQNSLLLVMKLYSVTPVKGFYMILYSQYQWFPGKARCIHLNKYINNWNMWKLRCNSGCMSLPWCTVMIGSTITIIIIIIIIITKTLLLLLLLVSALWRWHWQ